MADPALAISAQDRIALLSLAKAKDRVLAQRAAIVLACAERTLSNSAIARALQVSRPSVILWRKRFQEQGLQGLVAAEPRDQAHHLHVRRKRCVGAVEAAVRLAV